MKRTLIKPINYLLIATAILLFLFTIAIDNIELKYLPLHIISAILLYFNLKVLNKYGDKKILFEE